MSNKVEKKGSWWMLHNSGGKKDVALTMMIVTWILCCVLAIVGAVNEISYEGDKITFNEFNMGFATVVFTPIVGLYFGRRYTDIQKGMYQNQALHSKNEGKDEVGND